MRHTKCILLAVLNAIIFFKKSAVRDGGFVEAHLCKLRVIYMTRFLFEQRPELDFSSWW